MVCIWPLVRCEQGRREGANQNLDCWMPNKSDIYLSLMICFGTTRMDRARENEEEWKELIDREDDLRMSWLGNMNFVLIFCR